MGFAKHMEVAKALNAETYFTRPYTSQDKGTVENRIGQIRRFIFKKTDLSTVTDELVKRIEKYLKDRPVRKFKYKTPKKVLLEKIALITRTYNTIICTILGHIYHQYYQYQLLTILLEQQSFCSNIHLKMLPTN